MARKSNHTGLKIFLILLMLLFLAGAAFMVKLCIDIVDQPVVRDPAPTDVTIQLPEPTIEETEAPPETTLPVPEHVVATATISSTGDLLMHLPVVNTGRQSDGTYDFENIFRHLTEYTTATDYAVANLETTLYGTGKPWSGFPNFNCPDEIVDSAKEAGFDMLLTANNHSFDTGLDGYIRTLDVIQEKGLETLGTMRDETEPKWIIEDINGIQIGMICYTYETSNGTNTYPALNGLPMYGATYENVNCFHENRLDSFYTEIDGYLREMEEAGAEATMVYIHWGVEYQLTQNAKQSEIAQKLCDLGVDVIIGGHPHVVQPMDLLESTVDPDHKTVCLYSMGNAVSNQRLGNLSMVSTAHTEDGVLFSVTFCKYSDGTVYLQSTDLLPTWVYRNANFAPGEYNILPLDQETRDQWGEKYQIPENVVTSAGKSYDRTMAIVGDGLTE